MARRGVISVPGDKSISHRALLLASLAEGESRLEGVLPGEDCRSTASVLRKLGSVIPSLPEDGSVIRISGGGPAAFHAPADVLDCGNSGTTARLLLGVLAGLPLEATLTGDASLRARPMRRVTEPLARMGASFDEEGDGRLPLRVRGGSLKPISYRSPVASAQVKSALLLAGVTGGVSVEVVEPARSRDHTERMLRRAGVPVQEESTPDGWRVRMEGASGALRPLELTVPGDFSSAAFFLALGVLGAAGEGVEIEGVGLNPTRTGLLEVLREMGADIQIENLEDADDPSGEPSGTILARPSDLQAVSVGGALIPSLIDELPVLAVVAARASGVTEIRDATELRVKESDRIHVLVGNLEAVGVKVEELPDGLRIFGGQGPLQGRVFAHGDHRIAMAFGVLGALSGQRVVVDDPESASVSFPGFWPMLSASSA